MKALGVTFDIGLLLLDWANALFLLAIIGAAIDLGRQRLYSRRKPLRFDPIANPKVCIGMLAYNDELSIGGAVRGFKELKETASVVVVDNNSKDKTTIEAKKAGARVVGEPVQGYGAACIRALTEALEDSKTKGNIVCLVEGDQTYFPTDMRKMLSYLENVDLVVGTRTTCEIVAPDSQITPFILYGNIFIAKLLQLRFWGTYRITDVGIGFALIRPEALKKILPKLTVKRNYFSPHMLITALKCDLRVMECPIAFKKRVGKSKGVGSSISKGLFNGLKMIELILTA
ncbi:MAG: glycosyltransferase family 2 protein [Candidatus Micrarchaeota archaeon]